MANYYSKIAAAWHDATGPAGGPFKKYVLNDELLARIGSIDGKAILELGAGNGYFVRLMMTRKSGERPARLVVTDAAGALLRIAEQCFRVRVAEYRQLDARRPYPFESGTFDLILATMVFNELGDAGLRAALAECTRVLGSTGRLLATVLHPDFVERLKENGQVKPLGHGFYTIPGPGALRVPVVPRSPAGYESLLSAAGFRFTATAVHPDRRVLRERPGLRHAAGLPLGLVYDCTKLAPTTNGHSTHQAPAAGRTRLRVPGAHERHP